MNNGTKTQTDQKYSYEKLREMSSNDIVLLEMENNILSKLNPYGDTGAYLCIISAFFQIDDDRLEAIWPFYIKFMDSFDKNQAYNLFPAFLSVVENVSASKYIKENPLLLCEPLRTAMGRLANPMHLSALHPLFLKQCIQAGAYEITLQTICQNVEDFTSPFLTSRHILEYFFYAGCIFVAMENFEEALQMFGCVLAVPGQACSSIQVEAYRKYVLVSLLVYDMLYMPSTTISAAVAHATRSICKIYDDFAISYAKMDLDEIYKQMQKSDSEFVRDANLGLIKRCILALLRNKLRSVSQTYSVIGLSELATLDTIQTQSQCSPEELLSMILKMVNLCFPTSNHRLTGAS